MAAPALDVGIDLIDLWLRDLDTAPSQGMTDAQKTSIINDVYIRYSRFVERRAKLVTLLSSALADFQNYTTDANTGYPELLAVEHAGATARKPLKRMDWDELRALQDRDLNAGIQGDPTHYAAIKQEAVSDRWLMAFLPVPNVAFTIYALVQGEPTALSGTAVPDLSAADAYLMYRLSAVECGSILGYDSEYLGRLLRPVPEDIQRKMGVEVERFKPSLRPAEALTG